MGEYVGKLPVIPKNRFEDDGLRYPMYKEGMSFLEYMDKIKKWNEGFNRKSLKKEKNAESGRLPWFGPGFYNNK